MENCKFHKQKEAVTRCKICGAPLCEECEKVHQKYHACPKCAKNQLNFELANSKRGLKYIYLAILCLVADIALFITEIIISKNVASAYLIVSIIFFVLFAPFCTWLLIRRILAIKKLNELIRISERELDDTKNKNSQNEENNQK